MLNPKLKQGDRVRLLFMDGETLNPGTWGVVRSEFKDLDGTDAYYVDWDDGNKDNVGNKVSSLNLYSTQDAWDLGGKPKKPIEEKWSEKYKKSIDCKNPKGFSQKAHCQGRKKRALSESKKDPYKLTKKEMDHFVKSGKQQMGYSDEEAKEEIESIIQSIKNLPEQIKLYRIIQADSKDDIDTDRPGTHYAKYKEDLLDSHSFADGVGSNSFMITVMAPKNMVDFKETLNNNLLYPNENEVTLLNKGEGVKIVSIKKIAKKKTMNEDRSMEAFIKNADILKYFKINDKKMLFFLVTFLKLLAKSGVTNMFGAAPFLYMGRDYMDRHYGDSNLKNDEYFDEVLDMADEVRNIMITVTMNLIEDKYKIDSKEYGNDEDEDSMEQSKILSLANKHIQDLAKRVLQMYMSSF